MSLKLIGSGFGRTGTMSTKLALEQIGVGPCHHMLELMTNPEQYPKWKAVAEGAAPDWGHVFAGYPAQVDFPGASVWEETLNAFPDAKVLHTERPAEDWWASFDGTIGLFFQRFETLDLPPEVRAIFATMDQWLIPRVFTDFRDRDASIADFERNNARVREVVPADRLLVFNPADGWEPLCAFLNVPVPDTPFPRSNPREEFWALFGGEPA